MGHILIAFRRIEIPPPDSHASQTSAPGTSPDRTVLVRNQQVANSLLPFACAAPRLAVLCAHSPASPRRSARRKSTSSSAFSAAAPAIVASAMETGCSWSARDGYAGNALWGAARAAGQAAVRSVTEKAPLLPCRLGSPISHLASKPTNPTLHLLIPGWVYTVVVNGDACLANLCARNKSRVARYTLVMLLCRMQ